MFQVEEATHTLSDKETTSRMGWSRARLTCVFWDSTRNCLCRKGSWNRDSDSKTVVKCCKPSDCQQKPMISLDVFYPSTIIYYTDRGRQRLQPGSILSKYPDVSCGLHANAAVVVQCQSRNMFQLVIRSEMDCVST